LGLCNVKAIDLADASSTGTGIDTGDSIEYKQLIINTASN